MIVADLYQSIIFLSVYQKYINRLFK